MILISATTTSLADATIGATAAANIFATVDSSAVTTSDGLDPAIIRQLGPMYLATAAITATTFDATARSRLS